ncbi:AraC family transcriptional regulator [Paenibacillus abyssi]|uniref:HTH araC/xylS-type domain-containing protein n=1 Tax=Paenibacillus abyssi TaxID=1340531 RepID=A0A917G283_9BACL|nr:AraC family transcriptional regulator [Paenibacillus abyssi]GGG18891.1 hypothetical protein GCM10010916_39650 [Paenibacillus abyssi]
MVKARLNSQVSLHQHPVFHLLYILEGKGKVTVGETTTVAEPGMLYVISPNEPHRFLFGDGEPLTNFECTFRLLDRCRNSVVVHFGEAAGKLEAGPDMDWKEPIRVPSRLRPLVKEGFERILEAMNSPLLRQHSGILVAELMARVKTIANIAVRADQPIVPHEELIEGVKHFLFTNRSRAVSLSEAAGFAHVTPNYLCRIFKEHTGDSPMGYLQTVRMREAEKLLSFTDLPVYTIAEKLGFDEPSYFARVFRSVYGYSPQVYRKNLLQENRIK